MKTNADFTLRSFIDQAEAAGPDRVWRVKDQVALDYDATALTMELERAGRKPILVFEKVGDSRFPVVANVFGNRQNYANATLPTISSI